MRRFTIALYGDSGVGKTTLLHRLLKKPTEEIERTKGYDVQSSTFRGVPDIRWLDASGASRWVSQKPWLTNLDLIILVFALQSRDSWLNIGIWMRRCQKWHTDMPPIVVVGMNHGIERAVSSRTASSTIQLLNCPYFEIDLSEEKGTSAMEDLIELYVNGCHRHRSLVKRFSSGATRFPVSPPRSFCSICQCQTTSQT